MIANGQTFRDYRDQLKPRQYVSGTLKKGMAYMVNQERIVDEDFWVIRVRDFASNEKGCEFVTLLPCANYTEADAERKCRALVEGVKDD